MKGFRTQGTQGIKAKVKGFGMEIRGSLTQWLRREKLSQLSRNPLECDPNSLKIMARLRRFQIRHYRHFNTRIHDPLSQ